ncbi:MAG TPA: S1 RNA-binding domain-containing protein [Patescibacteria group bacterium]
MANTTTEYNVNCKRCGRPIGYSGMMYERMKEYGQSRPEYCEDCRAELLLEKMTMGAAYFSVKQLPGINISQPIPGELGKVYHPARPHVKVENPSTFDETKFGATPGKIVEIYEWLKDPDHQVVVVVGDTGSGKSTALPYWLIYPPEGVPSDFFIRDGQILITQPRIVATTSIAEYMGVLLGSSVGKGFDIGYRYSKDRNADRFNAAFLATDGSLINMIKNGQLADLSVVMIDEAHERSLNIDVILRLLKDQLPLYPHLKVLIVSATINQELFLSYFGKETATVVTFEGKRKFDYQKHFAEEAEKLPYENPGQLRRQLVPAMVRKIMWLLREQVGGAKSRGHILSFLQGVKPIDEAVSEVRRQVDADPNLKDKVEVFPLYSDLNDKEKDCALKGSNQNKIRVIISTNVAEASVTVEGVVYVIESGVENQAQWNIEKIEGRVELELISQANAKQRWGRSGRTQPGEVFCLYTEKQFESMVPFPIPAIQRSSMDQMILLLKDMGIDEIDDGWIQTPVEKELNRSYKSLQTSGAIDEDGMLTDYGAVLRNFAYEATLTDLILLADRFGVAEEVAVLLPVIKNGGHKSFLIWDGNWDQATKQKVTKLQQVLWQGCKDDAEFILKMYCWWVDPPVLDKKDSKKPVAQRRVDLGKAFYINFEVFAEDIDPEREQILRLLNAHKKDRNFRPVDITLIDRTRVILIFCLPNYVPVENEYSYNSRLETVSGSPATYQLKVGQEKKDVVGKIKAEGGSPLRLAREFLEWESGAEPYDSIFGRLFVDPELPVDDSAGFDTFIKSYKTGDDLDVTVTGVNSQSRDNRKSLVVREMVSGLEIWMEPADIAFTLSPMVVEHLPVGTNLRVRVRAIDQGNKKVNLSCLPIAEVKMKFDRLASTKAQVIEIRKDGKVVFIAETTQPEEGYVLVIHSNENVLGKPAGEFKVGETYSVSFTSPRTDWTYRANLISPSDKLLAYIFSPESLLEWEQGKVAFKGQMRYDQLMRLGEIDKDPNFLRAIDYIYLSSNMIWAKKVASESWLELVSATYPVGSLIDVKVLKVLSVGVICKVDDDLKGFVHVSKINPFRRIDNAMHVVSEDIELTAKVIGFDETRQQLNLSFIVPENSPLRNYKVGQKVTGYVDNLTDYGAFVELGLGYTGLIHKSNMGRRVNRPSDILAVDDFVEVEIIELREENGRLKIGLRLERIIS